MQSPCRNRTLASSPTASVQRCADCGVLSLHLGALTVRLDAAAAEALWATLGTALHELHAERVGPRDTVGCA